MNTDFDDRFDSEEEEDLEEEEKEDLEEEEEEDLMVLAATAAAAAAAFTVAHAVIKRTRQAHNSALKNRRGHVR